MIQVLFMLCLCKKKKKTRKAICRDKKRQAILRQAISWDKKRLAIYWDVTRRAISWDKKRQAISWDKKRCAISRDETRHDRLFLVLLSPQLGIRSSLYFLKVADGFSFGYWLIKRDDKYLLPWVIFYNL